MLPGFEDINHHLTDEEIQTLKDLVVPALKKKIGKANAVTNKAMREGVFKFYNVKISDPKMRRMIAYIRRCDLISKLCSCQKGMFVAENDGEWENWKESMRKRINELQHNLYCAEFFSDGGNEKL